MSQIYHVKKLTKLWYKCTVFWRVALETTYRNKYYSILSIRKSQLFLNPQSFTQKNIRDSAYNDK